MNKRVFAVKNTDKAISLSGTHIGKREQYLTKNGKILAFEKKFDAEQLAGKMTFQCEVVELGSKKGYFFNVSTGEIV